MSTGCEFYQDALVDHAAGRLDAERARRLEQHLAGCEDCRSALAVVRTVRRNPVTTPDGLEDRVRSAVRAAAGARHEAAAAGSAALGASTRRDDHARGPALAPSRTRWTPRWAWGVPLAAAAALALVWLGVGEGGGPVGEEGAVAEMEAVEPFGAWPAADGTVAGDPLLSELTEQELERLLEEMES